MGFEQTVMASQLRRRADRHPWYVHPGMIEDFLAEDGVVVGGARASGHLRDSDPIDVYIAGDVLDRLVERYIPDQSAAEPNLIARVVRGPRPFAHGERVVARLLPSSRGWFHASRHVSTAALS